MKKIKLFNKKKTSPNKELKLPTTEQLEQELKHENYKTRYKTLFRSTINILIVVVAISVLLATLFFPVLQIYGKSMMPTLVSNDIVLCVKKTNYKQGDIIAFYYNNRILVKRVIATERDWVKLDDDGNVYVNDKILSEDYVKEKSKGNTDIEFPYQVSEDSYFVMGDKRSNSVDSRNSQIGSVDNDDIIGKIVFKVWPLKNIGFVK